MEKWIQELLKNLDECADEKMKQSVLETCGSKCPFSHMPDEKLINLRKASDNEEDFLKELEQIWRLKKEDDKYYIVFDQCYCPLVNKNLKDATKTMCYCTLGSLKHKFKITLGRDVDVNMIKTVLSGDEECRFEIKI